MTNNVYLSSFRVCPTRFHAPQGWIQNFIGEVHERASGGDITQIRGSLSRYAVKEHHIARRGFECEDALLTASQRSIYRDGDEACIFQRAQFFGTRAMEIFEHFYPEGAEMPEHLVHVTCTGYQSPSAAQRLVAKRRWKTETTHAYHMGCYASMPAVRIAVGQAVQGKSADIVHTEMCSLHMNPHLNTPEQWIVQSLFADGHVAYRVSREKFGPSFLFRHVKEKIVPDTAEDMTWTPTPIGMAMTLSRHVPKRIGENLRDFCSELIAEAGLTWPEVVKKGLFAIHPGGPKIIESVQEKLELSDSQIAASKRILFDHGNMSSATLPYIWREILTANPPDGTPIVSLAFGPGLTMFGSVFEYRQ